MYDYIPNFCKKCDRVQTEEEVEEETESCTCGRKWTCGKCEGTGSIESFVFCSKPASMCCGGCTRMTGCDQCGYDVSAWDD